MVGNEGEGAMENVGEFAWSMVREKVGNGRRVGTFTGGWKRDGEGESDRKWKEDKEVVEWHGDGVEHWGVRGKEGERDLPRKGGGEKLGEIERGTGEFVGAGFGGGNSEGGGEGDGGRAMQRS